jgi:hypothetical protein
MRNARDGTSRSPANGVATTRAALLTIRVRAFAHGSRLFQSPTQAIEKSS